MLSVRSDVVFSADNLRIGSGYFYFGYLHGDPTVCLREFLDRERARGSGLLAAQRAFISCESLLLPAAEIPPFLFAVEAVAALPFFLAHRAFIAAPIFARA